MKKTTALALLSMMFVSSAYATASNNCGQLHLQITNLTRSACVLTNHNVIHGNLLTSPPMSILPYDSKRFDMAQTGFGPSVNLTYQCGQETITISSQQNVCVLRAGAINGAIVPPAPEKMTANFEAIEGSYYWDKAGSINWKLIELP